jgi:hypothetical protein
MADRTRYEITLRTDCHACAMAIAGHLPAASELRLVQVQRQTIDDDGAVIREIGVHINSPMMRMHDGSPMICEEHGAAIDLSKNPQ